MLKRLWPEFVQNSSTVSALEPKTENILQFMHGIHGKGFSSLHIADVEEILNSHDKELTEAELFDLLDDKSSNGAGKKKTLRRPKET